MMRALLLKEVRDQRAFAWFGLFLLALDVVFVLLNESPRLQPLHLTLPKLFGKGTAQTELMFFVAFALGTGLLVREQDDRTLEFLDALPTTRPALFLAKVSVALGVLGLYPLCSVLWAGVLHALSRESLDPSFHPGLLSVGLCLQLLGLLSALGLGLVLAPLRRLAWTVLALLWLGYDMASDALPSLTVLNPLRLTEPDFSGTGWVWPMKASLVQGGLALLFLGTALVQFVGFGGRAWGRLQRALEGTWKGGLLTVVTVGLVVAFFVRREMRPTETAGGGSEEAVEGATFAADAPAHAETAHYHFTYPSSLRRTVLPLVEGAEDVHQKVASLLGAGDGAPISADLSGSALHTAGTAFWGRLRMNAAGAASPEEALAILGHETAHVLASRRVGVRQDSSLSGMKLLMEGLAEYVEHRFFHAPSAREGLQLVAAAARARKQVSVEELLSPGRLEAERDGDWVYPLGRLFVEGMVERYGDASLPRLLDALGREDAPDVSGAQLWQEAFQAAGMDLPRLWDDFFAALDAEVARRKVELEALPRPRGVMEQQAPGWVALRLVTDTPPPAGWTPVVRFRPDEDSERSDLEGPFEGAGPHWRRRTQLSGGVLWFQAGLRSPAGPVLYERWTRLRVE